MALTNRSVFPPGSDAYFDRVLLINSYPNLIHGSFAQQKILPKNSGSTIIFRSIPRLETVPIPITDGVTGPGTSLSVVDIKAQIDWYANYVTITDQVQMVVENNPINDATRTLAENLSATIDEVTRDVLASTSSVLQCSYGSNGNLPTELTQEDISSVVATMLTNDARMITDVIEASNKFATAPVPASFFGFINAALIPDLEAVVGFLKSSNYSQLKALDNEWGTTGNVRWKYSSVASVSAAATPVYDNIILAKEAYAVINYGSAMGEFIVKPNGSAGSADPYNQRATVAWKKPFAACILNDLNMANLQSTRKI